MKRFLPVFMISMFLGVLCAMTIPFAEANAAQPVGGAAISGMHGGVHIHPGGMVPGPIIHRPPMGPPPVRHYYHNRVINPVYVRVRYASPYYCDPYYSDYYDPYYCPCPRRSVRHRIPSGGYSVIYYE